MYIHIYIYINVYINVYIYMYRYTILDMNLASVSLKMTGRASCCIFVVYFQELRLRVVSFNPHKTWQLTMKALHACWGAQQKRHMATPCQLYKSFCFMNICCNFLVSLESDINRCLRGG